MITLIRRNSVEVWHISDFPPQPLDRIGLFVCLFVQIKSGKLYFASCVGREVNLLGVIARGQRYKAGNLHVRGSCELRGHVPPKLTQLISRHVVGKTGNEAGTGIVRLLSKASNNGFSHHIKTG